MTITNNNVYNCFNTTVTSPHAGIYVGNGSSAWTITVNSIYQTSNIVVTENEWIHIVGTLTYGTGSTWKIYINGNIVPSQFRPGENGNEAPIQPTDTSIYLGPEDGSTGAEFLTGNISISRLYNRTLSAQEITQNFNALRGRYGI